jgi:hypothetical protein
MTVGLAPDLIQNDKAAYFCSHTISKPSPSTSWHTTFCIRTYKKEKKNIKSVHSAVVFLHGNSQFDYRVTSLWGYCLHWVITSKITKCPKFWATFFHGKSYKFNLTKMAFAVFWANLYANSAGHPVWLHKESS